MFSSQKNNYAHAFNNQTHVHVYTVKRNESLTLQRVHNMVYTKTTSHKTTIYETHLQLV